MVGNPKRTSLSESGIGSPPPGFQSRLRNLPSLQIGWAALDNNQIVYFEFVGKVLCFLPVVVRMMFTRLDKDQNLVRQCMNSSNIRTI